MYENSDILLQIPISVFNDEKLAYANKVVEMFPLKRDEILEYLLNSKQEVASFYKDAYGWDQEFIKNNLGRPYIIICSEGGMLQFIEHNLDEHIIDLEFYGLWEEFSYISMNG